MKRRGHVSYRKHTTIKMPVVATKATEPNGSSLRGLCSHEAMAFVYTLAKGICNGECR